MPQVTVITAIIQPIEPSGSNRISGIGNRLATNGPTLGMKFNKNAKTPKVIASHTDDTFTLDLTKVPAIAKNPTVQRILNIVTPVVGLRDIRTADDMLREILQCLPDEVTCEPIIKAEPSVLSPDPAFFDACEDILGTRPKERREHGGSDARFIAAQGIPVIMSRPLCGNLHSSQEWIDIDSMVQFYEIYRRYLEDRFDL